MNDNSYGTTFGPSTVGALNLVAGNTYGATCGDSGHVFSAGSATVPLCPAATGTATPGQDLPAGTGTVVGDSDPSYDGCSAGAAIAMGGRNIGDLLNARKITWGWFQGGFAPTSRTAVGQPVCGATHTIVNGTVELDYSAHHEPFQYYPQTANPLHLPPTSVAAIGRQDQANHQYDLSNFWAAADTGHLPAVSFLKAPRAEDAHSGNSDPLDEQRFLVSTISRLESLPTWSSTAVIIAYDDSNGWYDHQSGPLVTQSQTPFDQLTGSGTCGTNATAVPVSDSGAPEQGRCGLGPRLPLLVISPWVRTDYVDRTLTDQSSIIRFIEDNWHLPRLGNGSADATAGSIMSMFDFRRHGQEPR
jgi:phospholipase C